MGAGTPSLYMRTGMFAYRSIRRSWWHGAFIIILRQEYCAISPRIEVPSLGIFPYLVHGSLVNLPFGVDSAISGHEVGYINDWIRI